MLEIRTEDQKHCIINNIYSVSFQIHLGINLIIQKSSLKSSKTIRESVVPQGRLHTDFNLMKGN